MTFTPKEFRTLEKKKKNVTNENKTKLKFV